MTYPIITRGVDETNRIYCQDGLSRDGGARDLVTLFVSPTLFQLDMFEPHRGTITPSETTTIISSEADASTSRAESGTPLTPVEDDPADAVSRITMLCCSMSHTELIGRI